MHARPALATFTRKKPPGSGLRNPGCKMKGRAEETPCPEATQGPPLGPPAWTSLLEGGQVSFGHTPTQRSIVGHGVPSPGIVEQVLKANVAPQDSGQTRKTRYYSDREDPTGIFATWRRRGSEDRCRPTGLVLVSTCFRGVPRLDPRRMGILLGILDGQLNREHAKNFRHP